MPRGAPLDGFPRTKITAGVPNRNPLEAPRSGSFNDRRYSLIFGSHFQPDSSV
jgi:hypothetical protein